MSATTQAGRWVLYGASGYTGGLIAEEAVRRGHRPLLAGRSREKLQPLAQRLGLEVAVVSLEDGAGLRRLLEGTALVVHAAGPFVHTSAPMVQACLDARVHYLDITGEVPVFEAVFRQGEQARERGVVLLPGVGFDVVPTDCLARYVSDQLPGATELELAIAAIGQASAGTTKSMLEMLPTGGLVRRGGELRPWRLGQGARRVRFSDRERTVVPIPWGDLATAWQTTGIPDITTFMALPRSTARLLRWAAPAVTQVLSVDALRGGLERLVGRVVKGPGERQRQEGRSYVWARARAADGREVQAWLETVEGYAFTARSTVRAVEEVLAGSLRGALTPARAFGADFVLRIEGSRRLDQLPPAP